MRSNEWWKHKHNASAAGPDMDRIHELLDKDDLTPEEEEELEQLQREVFTKEYSEFIDEAGDEIAD